MERIVHCACLLLCIAAAPVASARAQTVKLPIAEGAWVKTDTACNAAVIAHVYGGHRFGTVYFYGPDHSLGPANETEPLTRAGKASDGFTMINEGPLEVLALPNGQAAVRAFSPSQGEQWRNTVRLCSAASLSARMRTALTRLGLLTTTAGRP